MTKNNGAAKKAAAKAGETTGEAAKAEAAEDAATTKAAEDAATTKAADDAAKAKAADKTEAAAPGRPKGKPEGWAQDDVAGYFSIDPAEVLAWRVYPDRIVAVTIAGQKLSEAI